MAIDQSFPCSLTGLVFHAVGYQDKLGEGTSLVTNDSTMK